MGNLKERESRRRASVVGSIIEQQPAEETKQRSAGRGRPKELELQYHLEKTENGCVLKAGVPQLSGEVCEDDGE